MRFKDLSKSDIEYIRGRYRSGLPRRVIQTELSEDYGVHRRTIRKWAKRLELGVKRENLSSPKILIYDIETPRLLAELWWSGKQFVNGNDTLGEPKIMSISWKWYGDDQVHALHWDLKTQCDKEMMTEFMEEYNKADVVVGINNNNFDNRWINARAAKHRLPLNTFVRSIDLQKQAKKLFRLPSYSLKYLGRWFEIPMQKLNHRGIDMWRDIQFSPDIRVRLEAMKEMIDYNVGDILATEGVFLRMLPYLNMQAHLGVEMGNANYSCPVCGESEDVYLFKTTTTRAGTIQHVMVCTKDDHMFKIGNRAYLNWINGK